MDEPFAVDAEFYEIPISPAKPFAGYVADPVTRARARMAQAIAFHDMATPRRAGGRRPITPPLPRLRVLPALAQAVEREALACILKRP